VTKGEYHGDICLIIGDDLVGDPVLDSLFFKERVTVKYFPDLSFSERFLEINRTLPNFDKLFQYHKFYLFDTYFKRWKTVLYIDCGMTIFAPIQPFFKIAQPYKLLAHSDAYPTHVWKLKDQFNKNFDSIYSEMLSRFDLNIDYFQTTMLLFDTRIIHDEMFQKIYSLALEYPITNSNDQGILALYFTNIEPLWEQIVFRYRSEYLYDYFKRKKKEKYIMVKANI
jgi:hypothetical protein